MPTPKQIIEYRIAYPGKGGDVMERLVMIRVDLAASSAREWAEANYGAPWKALYSRGFRVVKTEVRRAR